MNFPWFHGSVSRIDAERLLLKDGADGSFLVRASETRSGAHVLCVLMKKRIHQYRIFSDHGLMWVESNVGVEPQKFKGINNLIQSLRGENNGLICPLLDGIEKKQPPLEEQDSEDEDEQLADGGANGSAVGTTNQARITETEYIKEFFRARLEQQQSLGSLDSDFVSMLRGYINSGLTKDAKVLQEGGHCSHEGQSAHLQELQNLLAASGKELYRQLEIYVMKLTVIEQLFDRSSSKTSTLKGGKNDKLDNIAMKLANCNSLLNAVQCKAASAIQEVHRLQNTKYDKDEYMYTSLNEDDREKIVPAFRPSPKIVIPSTSFEVKVDGIKSYKAKILVDATGGTMQVIKLLNKDTRDEPVTYRHDKILELMKSRKNNLKLTVKFDGKTREYTFQSLKARETFCQLFQKMKNIHSNSSEIDQLSVFVGSWNMGGALPPESLKTWFTSQGHGKTRDMAMALMPHDLYVIGTQESALNEKEWVQLVKQELHKAVKVTNLKTVIVCSLWMIRLVVLVKPEHQHRLSQVQQSSVKTGIANTLGNKGAVGVSFSFCGTSFCFINSHLTSGAEKCARRNQNYKDILRGLELRERNLDIADVANRFNYVFWFGDLNYRLESTDIQNILNCIRDSHYLELLEIDQLRTERNKHAVLFGFNEEEITFPPTYRYEIGNRMKYAYRKVKKTGDRLNVPSWCDRVFWKAYPNMHVDITSYGCTANDITTSDHSPIFATFDVGIKSQHVPQGESQSGVVTVVFTEIEAKIKSNCSSSEFYIEFCSTCLEACVKSKPRNRISNNSQGFSTIKWDDFPTLYPFIEDVGYLVEQHFLLAVKCSESDESFGECLVSLNGKLSTNPLRFSGDLSHQGEKTGGIRGNVHIKETDKNRKVTRTLPRKSYEMVFFEPAEVALQQQAPSFGPVFTDSDLAAEYSTVDDDAHEYQSVDPLIFQPLPAPRYDSDDDHEYHSVDPATFQPPPTHSRNDDDDDHEYQSVDPATFQPPPTHSRNDDDDDHEYQSVEPGVFRPPLPQSRRPQVTPNSKVVAVAPSDNLYDSLVNLPEAGNKDRDSDPNEDYDRMPSRAARLPHAAGGGPHPPTSEPAPPPRRRKGLPPNLNSNNGHNEEDDIKSGSLHSLTTRKKEVFQSTSRSLPSPTTPTGDQRPELPAKKRLSGIDNRPPPPIEMSPTSSASSLNSDKDDRDPQPLTSPKVQQLRDSFEKISAGSESAKLKGGKHPRLGKLGGGGAGRTTSLDIRGTSADNSDSDREVIDRQLLPPRLPPRTTNSVITGSAIRTKWAQNKSLSQSDQHSPAQGGSKEERSRGTAAPEVAGGPNREPPPARGQSSPSAVHPLTRPLPLPPREDELPTDDWDQEDVYESITRPATIVEWLASLGLGQFARPMIANGWDQIDFLEDIREEDLLMIGVAKNEHIQRILSSVRMFKKQ